MWGSMRWRLRCTAPGTPLAGRHRDVTNEHQLAGKESNSRNLLALSFSYSGVIEMFAAKKITIKLPNSRPVRHCKTRCNPNRHNTVRGRTLHEPPDSSVGIIGVRSWVADPTNPTRSSRRRGSFSTSRKAAARPLRPRPTNPLR